MKSHAVRLDSAEIRLVSFDVFDTVITRKCGPPEVIFRIVGRKLRELGLLSLSPRAFERMRIDAERRTRQHCRSGEVTLAEIYAELNRFWFFPETTVRALMNCELDTERENLFVIPGALELVEQARCAGKRVVFVSDTYLPHDSLHEILAERALLKEGDGLYVSSQWGASKANGGLFPIMLEQERLAGEEVLHLGDSLFSDVQRAEEQGIHARQLTRGSLNRFEAALARSEGELSDHPETLAGLSRLARLGADETGETFIASRLGASLAGPILTAYVEWVLRTAMKRKLQRLYFLARDGEALLCLCKVLAPRLGATGIELKYLYGSRETWGPAALVSMDDKAAEFFAKQIAWSASAWEHCIEYLGFSLQEIKRTSLPGNWQSPRQKVEWKKQIFLDVAAHPDLGPALRQRLEEKTALAMRYMREQGLAEPTPYGLVDCGWSGTWTDILSDLAETQGGMKPLVFFMGQRRRDAPGRCETLAWMFDHQHGGGLKTIPDFFHVVVEFLLTANHGRTVGFEEADGRLQPRLTAVDWQGFDPGSWRAFRRALLDFAESYARRLQPNQETADLRPALNELVFLFWQQPTIQEAQFFAGHTIGLSPSRANTKTLARAYRWRDMLRLALRWRLPGYSPFWWHEGALVLSGSALRMSIGLAWEVREFLRALRDGGKSGLNAKYLIRLFAASARKLNRIRACREEDNFINFANATAQPKAHLHSLDPLPATSHSSTIS